MNTTVMENLEAVLKNFSLQELCDIALQEFPETTWNQIQQLILIHSEKLNMKNVIAVLLNTVKDLTKEEIENRISNLYLLAVGKTSKKIWVSYQLMGTISVANREILENIKSSIRRTGMLANIHMLKYNNKYVLSVEKKIITKKRGMKKQIPIYFQFFLNEPYLFSTRTTIEDKLMTAIVESLGYSNWKLCNLTGPNITDLLTLLKNKKNRISMTPLLCSEPELTPVIKITDSVIQFGQRDERAKYAKQIFGEKPPQLQNLSVSLKNVTWQQVDDFDIMNGTPLDGAMALTFRAPNVAEQFKELITNGIVSEEIPQYMKALLYAGKNNLKITKPN